MPSGMRASFPFASFEIFETSFLAASLDGDDMARISLPSERAKYL